MRKSVCILTHKYLDNCGVSFHIGGVETIVGVLAQYLRKHYDITILQLSNIPFERDIDGITVLGFRQEKKLRNHYNRYIQSQFSFSIFLTYQWGRWIKNEKALVFQHGIEFDGFFSRRTGLVKFLQKVLIRYRHRRYLIATRQILDRASKVLCVDLNFVNWVRATFPFDRWEDKLTYLPNFSPQVEKEIVLRKADGQMSKSELCVIIPRRFEAHRGVIPMAHIANRITRIRPNVRFCFLGDGSQREELEQLLKDNKRCSIKVASYSEMPQKYIDADISIIPTLWSEGTSLACIESMSYGCAVLATNVGGLGNLILHDYNGSLVSPQNECISKELLRMIDNASLRKRYIEKGYEIASSCFTQKKWVECVMEHMRGVDDVES